MTIWKASASLMSFQQYWTIVLKNPVRAFLALLQHCPRHVSTMFHKRLGQAVSNDHVLLAELDEDFSLVDKKHFSSSADFPLSMSIETISMALLISFCVAVSELMVVLKIFCGINESCHCPKRCTKNIGFEQKPHIYLCF